MKKQTKESEAIDDSSSIKALIKRYGNVIQTGLQFVERNQNLKTLNVSPSFDLGLNGGLLEGTLTVISGDEKVGKSSLCLQICANAQAEGREVIYVDGEHRLKNYTLLNIKNLDLSKFQIVRSEEGCPPLSAEDMLNILENLIKLPSNKGAVAVIDSTSSLVPRAELDGEVSGTLRANLPKLLAHFFKKNAQIINNQRITLLVITHYITNTSGYGKTKVPDCGKYLQYQADTRIDCKKAEPWLDGETKIGQITEWDISCSSKGASGRKCISYLRYGVGIDFIQEIIELGQELGLINKAGAWYTCPFMEKHVENYNESDYRCQGVAKLYDYFKDNPETFKLLEQEVKEMLC